MEDNKRMPEDVEAWITTTSLKCRVAGSWRRLARPMLQVRC